MSKKITRPLSVLLSVLMVVSLFTIVPFTASAASAPTVRYEPVDTLEDGGEYLIVNQKTAGETRYALTRDNTSISRTKVSVLGGSPVYIEDGTYDNCVWTASELSTDGRFNLKNGSYYLVANSGTLNCTTSEPTNNWISHNYWSYNGTNSRLSFTTGGFLSSDSTYYLRYYNNSFSAVTTTNSIYLYKKVTYYTINASATASEGASGTISPSGELRVNPGANQTFTITPNDGSRVASFKVDGEDATLTNNRYTFNNIDDNHTIAVTFEKIPTYDITATVEGTGGSISPIGTTTLREGASQTYTVTPGNGYGVDKVTVDGKDTVLSDNNTYTFSNVDANHSISVSFKQKATKFYYKRVNTLTAGNQYIIANVTADATTTSRSGVAVSTTNGSNNRPQAANVTVEYGNKGEGNVAYVSEVAGNNFDSVLWTASTNGDYFSLHNASNRYLKRNGDYLNSSTGVEDSNRWNMNNGILRDTIVNLWIFTTDYYVSYSNSTFTMGTSSSNMYIYEKTVQPDYTVLFRNEDGSTLQNTTMYYGETPSYSGTPTKASTTEGVQYVFDGWDKEIVPVTGNAVYTATYKTQYQITWDKANGEANETEWVDAGTVPAYSGTDPEKAADAQYTYNFKEWSPAPVAAAAPATYTATYDTTTNKYTITWQNDDGSEIDTTEVEYGSTPTHADATKTSTTEGVQYVFTGWDPAVVSVTGTATYKATFKTQYQITWDKANGSANETEWVDAGTVPAYSGADPEKAADAQYTYNFKEWSPAPVAAAAPATYTATYDTTVNKYTITWTMDDDTVIDTTEVEYGSTPAHADATKTSTTDGVQYVFTGWDPEVVSVTGTATYKATFKTQYQITWDKANGETNDTTWVDAGTVPTHADPTKAADAQYTYNFKEWSPAPVAAAAPATYTATYDTTTNKYTITWKDGDNNTLKTEELEYGATPSYTGDTPKKTGTAQYTYTFNGNWSPEITSVTGNATYTAQYNVKAASLVPQKSLTLNGNVTVNFFIDPLALGITPEDVATESKTLTVTFAWAEGDNPRKDISKYEAQTITLTKDNYKNIGDTFPVTCDVCAAEMTCGILVNVEVDGVTTQSEKTYCVRDYGKTVLDPNSSFSLKYKADNDDDEYNDLCDLVKAMLNYGAKAQLVFGVKTGDLANDFFNSEDEIADVTDTMFETAIKKANGGEINGRVGDDISAVAEKFGANLFTTSVFFLENNEIRHVFTKANDSFNPELFPEGNNQHNFYYWVQSNGIAAAELDTLQTFTVGNTVFKYSVLDYARKLASSTENSEDAKYIATNNLAKAIYWYNQAANAYFPAS